MDLKISAIKNGNTTAAERLQNSVRPSFTGAQSFTKEITEGLYHARTIRRMESLKWLKGEIGGILITAFGTGFVAPIFIGFNPFTRPPKNATKEQKEEFNNTKKYTAMRQPISAGLAILFQAGVQKYIDKGLDKVFNDPEIAKFARVNLDQSRLNTETRVKDIVTKEMKAAGKKKPLAIFAIFSNEAKEQRKAYKDEFSSLVKAKQDAQIEVVAKDFESTGFIKPGERNVENSKVAELVNKQIDEYIQDAIKLKKTEDKQIPYYLKRGKILVGNREKLREILNPLINANSVTEEKLKELIAQNENIPEVKMILEEIKNKPEDLRMHRITRTVQRIETLEKLLGRDLLIDGKFNKESYRKKLIARNNVLSDIISKLAGQKFENVQAADECAIKKAVEKIAEICDFSKRTANEKEILKNTDTFGEEIGTLTSKIFKDVTKRYKKLVANNYTSWNQISKIGIGVFITLPITCTALNWVYPRFMEIFCPKLAGVKKAQQSKQESNKVGGGK